MIKTVLLAASLLTAVAPAFAQTGRPAPQPAPQAGQQSRGTPDDEKACKGDAIKLCPDVMGNDLAVLGCFKQNRAKLSRGCTAVLQGYGQL